MMSSKTLQTDPGSYPWGHDRRFNAYSRFFVRRFGSRVQKLSIDAGFTCPNRDGRRGRGGCTFCDNRAFNPSYCHPDKPVRQQLEEGIRFHRKRYRRTDRYLAYFQAFSNTYAPLERLKGLYGEALAVPGIIGLVIGTRPDCVDEQILQYLAQLAEQYFVVVEYGIESCYNHTLERINRGHSFEETATAIQQTAALGIHTGGHLIFGLPGETPEEMLAEADILSTLPLHSIKFHQLQIIRNTAMEKEFRERPEDFHTFGLDEYLHFVVQFLERLSPDIMIERFAGETPPRFISGPRWGGVRSDQVITRVEELLLEMNTWQGRMYNETKTKKISHGKVS